MNDDELEHSLDELFSDYTPPDAKGQAAPAPRPRRAPAASPPPEQEAAADGSLLAGYGREALIFRALAENAADAILISDLGGRVIYGNPACYEMFGPDEEQRTLVGRLLVSLWPEESVSLLTERVLPRAMSGNWSGETHLLRNDGRIFDAQVMAFAVLDLAGQPICVLLTVRDITERKWLEQVIQESLERRTRQVQLSTEVAQEIAAAPALNELFRRVVTLVKERFGYSHVQIFRHDPEREAMVVVEGYGAAGEKMKAAGHSLPYGKGVVGTAAATGEPVLAADVAADPHWVPHPDLPATRGELAVPIRLRDVVLGVLDVQSDEPGALSEEDQIVLLGLAGQVASAMENTRLLEEASTFRQFAEASGQGVGMATLDGNVIYANPTLCRMLEVDLQAVLGKLVLEFYPPDVHPVMQKQVLPTVMEKGQWVGELTLQTVAGGLLPTLENFFLIRDEQDRPRYLAGLLTDIGERKRIESLLEKQVRELDCLNDIGRKIDETPEVSTFLEWVAQRIPLAMQYPDVCVAAIVYQGRMHGTAEAMTLPHQIVGSLRIGGELLGRLYVAYTQKREFLDEESALLGGIIRRVTGYLENRRLFEQTRSALAQVEALYTTSQSMIRAGTIEEMLQALAGPALAASPCDATLFYVDVDAAGRPEWGEVVAYIQTTQTPAMSIGARYALADFSLGRLLVADPEQPQMVEDIAGVPELGGDVAQVLHAAHVQAVVLVPLTLSGRWLGFVLLTWPEPRAFTVEERQFYSTLGPQFAALVESRRLFEQARARAERELLIRRITDRMQQATDMGALMRVTAEELNRVLNGSRAYVRFGQPVRSGDRGTECDSE